MLCPLASRVFSAGPANYAHPPTPFCTVQAVSLLALAWQTLPSIGPIFIVEPHTDTPRDPSSPTVDADDPIADPPTHAAGTGTARTPGPSILDRTRAAGASGNPTTLAAIVFAGFVIAALVALRREYYPQADLAILEFKLHDLTSSPPLVGAYSRFQWSHPGPLMYYALWPAYKVLGSSSSAMISATILWHGAFAGLGAWLAARIGGRLGAVAYAVGLGLLILGPGAEWVVTPWNPYLNLFVFGAFVLACWGVALRDPTGFVLAPVLGTVLIQNHVGLLAPVLGGLGLSALLAVINLAQVEPPVCDDTQGDSSAEHGGDPRPSRWGWVPTRALGIGLGAAALAWIPPLYQQLRFSPGNLGVLTQFFTKAESPEEQRQGLSSAARLMSGYFSVNASWFGNGMTVNGLTGGLDDTQVGLASWPIVAVLAVVATILAFRTRLSRLATLMVLLGGFAFVAWISIAAIIGAAFPYLLIWVDVLSLIVAMAAVAIFAMVARSWLRDSSKVPAPAALPRALAAAVTLAASVTACVAISAAPNPLSDREDLVAELSNQLLGQVPEAAPVWFMNPSNEEARTFITALMLQLEKAGHPTTATLNERLGLGVARTKETADGDTQLLVAEGSSIEEIAKDPSNTRVAYVDEFTPQERVKLAELEASVEAARLNPGTDEYTRGLNAAAVDQLLKFRANRLRVAVFEHVDPPAAAAG